MAISFLSGSSQYATVADHADFSVGASGSCAISAWVQTSSPSDTGNIYRHDANSSSRDIIGLRKASGKWQLLFGYAGGTLDQISFGTVPNTVLTHVAWSTDIANGKYFCYVNGALDSNPAKTATNAVNPDGLGLAATWDGGELWHGQIMELAFWSGAELTLDDIKLLYTGGTPTQRMPLLVHPSSLKAYWPMLDAAQSAIAATLHDASGNGHDATTVGNPTGQAWGMGNLSAPLAVNVYTPSAGHVPYNLILQGAA